jgi:hypothetical protein
MPDNQPSNAPDAIPPEARDAPTAAAVLDDPRMQDDAAGGGLGGAKAAEGGAPAATPAGGPGSGAAGAAGEARGQLTGDMDAGARGSAG